MKDKIRVAVIFGGKSAEHEVSLQSAKNVIEAIDKKKYELILIGISKTGTWLLYDNDDYLLNENDPEKISLNKSGNQIALNPGDGKGRLVNISENEPVADIDVIFPVLHGTFGEDGAIQGLFRILNIPFVGAGVLGSSAGMDKDVMKRLLKEAGIPIADFLVYDNHNISSCTFDAVKEKLGMPVFIKPANLGSSVGISKVNKEKEFQPAVEEALKYDVKIIIEENIPGREIECSVLGNENPEASLPGEIIPLKEFYSYDAKYTDDEGSRLEIPAKLPEETAHRLQNMAVNAYRVLCCEGMARVDFFLRADGEILVNEINTIPGFTRISMYPKLWEASGLSYPRLIDRLIDLAMERFKRDSGLKTSF